MRCNSQDVIHWNKCDINEATGLLTAMYGFNLDGIESVNADPSVSVDDPDISDDQKKTIFNGKVIEDIEDDKEKEWARIVSQGEVDLKQTDTFIIQNGNIYDFGGYWNYNFGNSYEENHMEKKGGEINK